MISFCEPIRADFNNVSQLLNKSYKDGWLSNFGPAHQKFKKKLAKYLQLPDHKTIILTSSGHTALMTAYHILDVKSLAVPAFTFASTLTAASLQGIRTNIYDVNKQATLDITNIQSNDDTLALVCPLSIRPNINQYIGYCKSNNKKLIIDGAATFGTLDLCHYGDAFCLSFHATKTLSIGEGGALICDKTLEDKALEYINFGLNKNKQLNSIGINAKMSEYTAAIGLDILSRIKPYIANKEFLAEYYYHYLREFTIPVDFSTVYQSFPIFHPNAEKIRNNLMIYDIDVKQYYPSLDPACSTASDLYATNICLPLHHKMSLNDVQKICNIILQD